MPNRSILAFFWQHIRPYKWFYLVMLAAPAVASFYPFVYNYAIKLFLDTMDTHTVQLTYQTLLYPIVLFLSAQLILDVVWRISNIAEWKSEPYVRRSIIMQSYDYVQHHSYSFFQDTPSGVISSKLKGLLDGYDKFWEEMHHGILTKVLRILVNLSALLFVNTYLGLFIGIWSIIYVGIMYKLSLRVNHFSYLSANSRHTIIGLISDKITNVLSIFAFAARKDELRMLDEQIVTDFIPKQIRMYHYNFIMQLIGGLLYLILFAFTLFFMIHLRMQNVISIGDFAFVFGISLVTTDDIWHTTVSLQDFARAMGDVKSSLSILNTAQENVDLPNAREFIIKTAAIEFKDLHFGYNTTDIFNGLNLSIHAGEKIGLVGHSGAGKSTLINLLLGYFKYDSGLISIDNQDIKTVTQDSLRENIAVIPQDTMLFHRTIMENIRIGKPSATDAEVIAASEKAHIHEYILTLPEQYNAYVGERGVKLSGGQRQRIAIARAILKDAPLLILDEATSSLDSHTEQLIQESLNLFIEDRRKTVIAVAHRLSTLKHMDRIIVLDKGIIVEEGTHEQLINISDSLYSKLWRYQEI